MAWEKWFLMEISGKVALGCSKYFFDHSKARSTARVVKRECGLQNRMTAALQHWMILFSELLFRVFQSSLIGILTLALLGCAGLYFHHIPLEEALAPAGVISNLGFREHWQGFFWYGEKIGFSHFRIEEAKDLPGTFKISSEAVIRFKMLGIKKESLLKEVDYVAPDLQLLRTSGEQKLDGKIRRVEAEVVDGGVRLRTESEGKWEERLIPVEGPIYPSLAQYLYPPLKGMDIGRQYRYHIFSPQSLSVMEVNQRVLALKRSDLFEGPAFEIKTKVSGINPKVWINMRGEMVFEMGGSTCGAKWCSRWSGPSSRRRRMSLRPNGLSMSRVYPRRTSSWTTAW
jgi:hypothetical protein